jgi:hypothetical protein
MLHLNIIPAQLIECLAFDGSDFHRTVGTTRCSASQVPGVNENGALHNHSSKTGQPRRRNKNVGRTWHLPLVHVLEIQVRGKGWRRRKKRVVASLLKHVLSYPTETRSRLQIGIRLLSAYVKQNIGGGDTKDDFVDLESTRIGETVNPGHLVGFINVSYTHGS